MVIGCGEKRRRHSEFYWRDEVGNNGKWERGLVEKVRRISGVAECEFEMGHSEFELLRFY